MAASAPPAGTQRLGVTLVRKRSGTPPPLDNLNAYQGEAPPRGPIGCGARLSRRCGSDIRESGLEAWQPSWGPGPLHVRRRERLGHVVRPALWRARGEASASRDFRAPETAASLRLRSRCAPEPQFSLSSPAAKVDRTPLRAVASVRGAVEAGGAASATGGGGEREPPSSSLIPELTGVPLQPRLPCGGFVAARDGRPAPGPPRLWQGG